MYKISDVYIEHRNAKRENKKKKLIEIEVCKSVERSLPTSEEEEIEMEEASEGRSCASCLLTLNKSNFERKVVGSKNRGDLVLQLTSNTENVNVPNFALSSTTEQSSRLGETALRSSILPSVKSQSVCNECWLYWKKYGSLKHHEAHNAGKHPLYF